MEKWVPRVGDKVRLLKSELNWGSEDITKHSSHRVTMSTIVKNHPIVTILTICTEHDDGEPFPDGDFAITFEEDDGWQWRYSDGHFEPYTEKTSKIEATHLKNILKKTQCK